MSKWTVVRDNSLGKCAPGSIKALTKATEQTTSLSVEEMKKKSNALFDAKVAREDKLLELAKEGTLKSPALIAEADKIEAKRKEKAEKEAAAATKVDTVAE